MKSIKTIKKQAIKAVQLSFKSGKLDETIAKKFVKSFKTLSLPQAIQSLNLYKKGLNREILKKTLIVESVIPLSNKDMVKIKSVVLNKFSILETKNVLNKSLLGGLRITVGDVLIDDSIVGRIKQVKGAITGQ